MVKIFPGNPFNSLSERLTFAFFNILQTNAWFDESTGFPVIRSASFKIEKLFKFVQETKIASTSSDAAASIAFSVSRSFIYATTDSDSLSNEIDEVI